MILTFVEDKEIQYEISEKRINALKATENDIPEGTIILAFCVDSVSKTFECPLYGVLHRYINGAQGWYILVDEEKLDCLPRDIVIPQESFTDEDKTLFTTLRLANKFNRTDDNL